MIIAMAGLAEAAIFFQLLIAAVILLVVTGLLALAWWKRSWVATIIGCVFMLIAGALLQPWVVFGPPDSDDPDEMDLLVKYRIASVIWALLLIAATATVVRVRKAKREARKSSLASSP